jgi:hypothetical protein
MELVRSGKGAGMKKKLNRIRKEIVAQLQQFLQLQARMDEFEKHYLAYVLLPSYQLQASIQMRKYLEQEYRRISKAMESGMFIDSSEIEKEVCEALRHADTAFGYLPDGNSYGGPDHPGSHVLSEASEAEYEIDAAAKEKLVKEFKKIVLPKIHADTSDAPFEVFDAAFEAYKEKDYLMLAAFVIQYRGDSEDENSLHHERTAEYSKVCKAIRKRVNRLREDPAMLQLENREQVLAQMKKQNVEIRKAAMQETEQLLQVRSCLEQLIQVQFTKGEVN